MAILVNRAKMTTVTTGTGTITLGSASSGYQTFAAAGVANGDTVRYVIEDGTAWEIGTGVYTAAGTTLSRTVSQSSNAGSAINLSGSAVVFVSAVEADIVQLDKAQTLTAKTLAAPTITGTPTETVYAITGTTPALNPANGSLQTWTLTGNSTPTDSVAAGQAITLMIDDGTAYTITWPSVTWVNNAKVAPTLATTGYTTVTLWKVGTTLYGAVVGNGT